MKNEFYELIGQNMTMHDLEREFEYNINPYTIKDLEKGDLECGDINIIIKIEKEDIKELKRIYEYEDEKYLDVLDEITLYIENIIIEE